MYPGGRKSDIQLLTTIRPDRVNLATFSTGEDTIEISKTGFESIFLAISLIIGEKQLLVQRLVAEEILELVSYRKAT